VRQIRSDHSLNRKKGLYWIRAVRDNCIGIERRRIMRVTPLTPVCVLAAALMFLAASPARAGCVSQQVGQLTYHSFSR
jgi:hypothetical protein